MKNKKAQIGYFLLLMLIIIFGSGLIARNYIIYRESCLFEKASDFCNKEGHDLHSMNIIQEPMIFSCLYNEREGTGETNYFLKSELNECKRFK